MKTTYHYCAMTQHDIGAIAYVDGTITVKGAPDLSGEVDYRQVKSVIAEQFKPPADIGSVTILSLTVLSAV
ncbi:hypothetical protein [Thermomonas fusca]|uniref:hypothetical protein n=1 Tax=Thermomonas fusca TaxID=215690 RepID=UPI0012EBB5FD|nr:hypothetical protein [Thermomonas fusca]